MITVDPESKEVIYNPEFYVTKHFSNFIKKGAVRLGTKGHWTGNSVAFENPDGEIVVVTANALAKKRIFAFKGSKVDFTVELKPYSFNTFVVK